jgi:hypothetical protein
VAEKPELLEESLYTNAEHERYNLRNPSVESCLPFLFSNDLMMSGRDLKIRNGDEYVKAQSLLAGVPIQRSEKKTKAEINKILNDYKNLSQKHQLKNDEMEYIWSTFKNPRDFFLFDSNKLSPDTLAFYRPFHFTPEGDWGIYILVDRLLEYYIKVKESLGSRKYLFQSDILLGYIVFEVFHHEFFHHIVESATTSLEIVSSAFGNPQPLYRNYFNQSYQTQAGLGKHVHDPLEEALANAYAFNSFSFSTRINKGYKSMLVKAYQKAMEKGWKYDPPGYREAVTYTNSGYVYGATQLLAMILNSSLIDINAASIVAKNVLINGHSAFCSKPDIPTYLVGNESQLRHFYELLPAPNETCSNLFWHEDFEQLEKYINERRALEKKKTKR